MSVSNRKKERGADAGKNPFLTGKGKGRGQKREESQENIEIRRMHKGRKDFSPLSSFLGRGKGELSDGDR